MNDPDAMRDDYLSGFVHGLHEGTRAVLSVMVGKPFKFNGRILTEASPMPPLDPSLVTREVREWALDILATLEERSPDL